MAKLGALLEHSVRSGSQPPSCQQYPLMVLGAPTRTKWEALKEAHTAYVKALEDLRLSNVVNRFVGVTPWWALPGHENVFVGPNQLSSCVTTKQCRIESRLSCQDGTLREMLVRGADVSDLLKSFQGPDLKTFSRALFCEEPVVSVGQRISPVGVQNQGNRRTQNRKTLVKPGFSWKVSASGLAIQIHSSSNGRQQSGSRREFDGNKCAIATGIKARIDTIAGGQMSGKNKSNMDKRPWWWGPGSRNSDLQDSRSSLLSVTGSKPCVARRCDSLPPVNDIAKKCRATHGQNSRPNISVKVTRAPGLVIRPKSKTPVEDSDDRGDKLGGWEWPQPVLPPPFPDTMRRSDRPQRPRPRVKSVRDPYPTPATNKEARPAPKRRRETRQGKQGRRRRRRRSESLKSCSSGPSASSSSSCCSGDEDLSVKAAMKKSSQQGQTPKKLEDIFKIILPKPRLPYSVKKFLEAKRQKEKEEAEEESRILDRGAGGDNSKVVVPSGDRKSASSPLTTPSPGSSNRGDVSVLAEYDMLSDMEEAKEAWSKCFPAVRYSNKKKRWRKAKHPSRSALYAKAAVLVGLGGL